MDTSAAAALFPDIHKTTARVSGHDVEVGEFKSADMIGNTTIDVVL